MILKERAWFDLPQTVEVISLLNSVENHESRFVGGCVRNALLGLSVADIDIATTLFPEQVISLCDSHDIKVIPTGIDHGTVTLIYSGTSYEVTTLREDISTDGRRADVLFTNKWEKDAARRDFTMNALYLSKDGELFDFFEGQKDLKDHHVRFIGDAHTRIQEDYLRIFRFFRFSSYYGGGCFNDIGLKSCAQNIEGICKLSKERIRDEFFKILVSPYVLSAVEYMLSSGVLSKILPCINIDLFRSYCQCEERIGGEKNALFRLFVLSAFSDVRDLVSFFRLSNKQKKQLDLWSSCKSDDEKTLFEKLYFYGAETLYPLCVLDKDFEQLSFLREWKKPLYPVSAQDLKLQGVQEGKLMGELLRRGEVFWVSKNCAPSKEDVLEYLFS